MLTTTTLLATPPLSTPRNARAFSVTQCAPPRSRSISLKAASSITPKPTTPKPHTPSHTTSDPDRLPKMQPDETAPWIALVCSAEWLLHDVQNESFAEQLRERVRLYADGGQPLNFHLVSQPAWLDTLFPEEAKRIGRPAVALVCPDKDWMTFVQIRLDRVKRFELPASMTVTEATESLGPVPDFPEYEGWRAPYSPYAKGWWERFEFHAA